MKKYLIFALAFVLQGCASDFLVNKAHGAFQYEAIEQLPKEDVIGQQVYVGGQIATINRAQNQVELIKRKINASGYPEEGSNRFDDRIFVRLSPQLRFNYYNTLPGDRMAVLGRLVNIQKVNVAGNEMTVLEVDAEDYRTWNSRPNRWDDDPYGWNIFHRHGRYYRPWYY